MSGTDTPLVSVIIPAYGCAHTLPDAIDSALNQHVPVEILVIDDCSPDDLSLVMTRYQAEPRVHYVQNPRNMGAATSRNQGVAMASGDYVAFLDGDDMWAPEKLTLQLDVMVSSGAVLCCTAREMMNPDGSMTGHVIPVRETITYRDLLRHNSINCSSVLLKRDVALAFPMEHEDSHEDYITWLGILRQYGFARGVNLPLLKYRKSSTGKSGGKLHSAGMTWRAYRYMGFGTVKSLCCFVSYAFHGVYKHFLSK